MKKHFAFICTLIIVTGSLHAMKDIEQAIEEHKDSPQKLAGLLVEIANIDKKEFDVQVAQKLVDSGVDIASDMFEQAAAALRKAAISGHCEYVHFLLDKNANIESQNNGTPLVWAAYHDRIKMVDLLLNRKADPNATDDKSRSALTSVCRVRSKHEIATLLLAAGANVNHRDAEFKTPLLHFREIESLFYGQDWWFQEGETIEAELMRAGAKEYKHQVLMNPEGQVVQIIDVSEDNQIPEMALDESGKLKEGWNMVCPLLEK